MSKFDDFKSGVVEGAKTLAKGLFKDFQTQATQDTKAFLSKAEEDLQRWTKLLASNDLTKQDFEDLVKAKKALAEMHALTEAGVLAATVERFRTGLINLIVDAAFKVFP
jgi:hypothetical protein